MAIHFEEPLESEYEKLIKELRGYGRLAVAFSAGVDSTFLLWAAREALGENVIVNVKESRVAISAEMAQKIMV